MFSVPRSIQHWRLSLRYLDILPSPLPQKRKLCGCKQHGCWFWFWFCFKQKKCKFMQLDKKLKFQIVQPPENAYSEPKCTHSTWHLPHLQFSVLTLLWNLLSACCSSCLVFPLGTLSLSLHRFRLWLWWKQLKHLWNFAVAHSHHSFVKRLGVPIQYFSLAWLQRWRDLSVGQSSAWSLAHMSFSALLCSWHCKFLLWALWVTCPKTSTSLFIIFDFFQGRANLRYSSSQKCR